MVVGVGVEGDRLEVVEGGRERDQAQGGGLRFPGVKPRGRQALNLLSN